MRQKIAIGVLLTLITVFGIALSSILIHSSVSAADTNAIQDPVDPIHHTVEYTTDLGDTFVNRDTITDELNSITSVAAVTVPTETKATVREQASAPATTVQSTPIETKAAPVQAAVAAPAPTQTAAASVPVVRLGSRIPDRVIVPSAGIDSPVIPVGLTASGDMAVPSGSSNNIGWWKGGTVPGNYGSAVFDAHVFAALKNLKYVHVGDDVYVYTEGGKKLHFVVIETTVYPLAQTPAQKLFSRSGDRYLNLITCAGNLTPDHSTYDHRLIVYTSYIGEE